IILVVILVCHFGFTQIKSKKACKINTNQICRLLYDSTGDSNPAEKFEEGILKVSKSLNLYPELSDKSISELSEIEKIKIISRFFNDNNNCLICGNDTSLKIRNNEHILKRSISSNMPHLLRKALETENYDIDYNFYEIVNGKKETILDFIDKILSNEDLMRTYDKEELEDLMDMIEDSGGKRGKELK
ncbi:MAG: hypothetical protein AAFQ94_28360, partial [Bacteroidota bacterium]